MSIDQSPLADIPGLHRVETTSRDEMMATAAEMTHAVYPHDQVYGPYCTIQGHIDCPPELVFDYLKKGHHLEEWTYSLRGFKPAGQPGLWKGEDRLEPGTAISTSPATCPATRSRPRSTPATPAPTPNCGTTPCSSPRRGGTTWPGTRPPST